MQLPGQYISHNILWLELTTFRFCQKWLNYSPKVFNPSPTFMHLTSNYINASYNQADFWTICKQKDWPTCPQGHHVHQRKKHIIWMLQCSHAVYCLNAVRRLVLSHSLIPVRTFGTHRVGEDDVLLEKWVVPCYISAPERSNTNMQSSQRKTVPVMSFSWRLCSYSATELLRILCPE